LFIKFNFPNGRVVALKYRSLCLFCAFCSTTSAFTAHCTAVTLRKLTYYGVPGRS